VGQYRAAGIEFTQHQCKDPLPTVAINRAMSLCLLFGCLFTEENGVQFDAPE
jgi:hypothetical protein